MLEIGPAAPRRPGPGQGQRLDLRAQGGDAVPVGRPGHDRRDRGQGRGPAQGACTARAWTCPGTIRAARSWRRPSGVATGASARSSAGPGGRAPASTPGTSTSSFRPLAGGLRRGGPRPGLVCPARHPGRRAAAVGAPGRRRLDGLPGARAGAGLAARTTADCHWGPCSNCGVPAATGFALRHGRGRPAPAPGTRAAAPAAGAGSRRGPASRERVEAALAARLRPRRGGPLPVAPGRGPCGSGPCDGAGSRSP